MVKSDIIWFKGSVIPADEALVNVMSPTSQFGLNVFEGVRGYWNANHRKLYIFRFNDHLDRLFESCKILSLICPYSSSEIWQFVNDLIIVGKYRTDVALRLTLFVDGNGSWNSLDPADLFISPIVRLRKDVTKLTGSSACLSSWHRTSDVTMPPRVKTGANYVASRYAHLEANRASYDHPIFLNSRGTISEGAGACIFIVRKNKLITPTLQCSVLESITRDTLIKLSQSMGISVIEREIDRTELLIADEVFLCGSAAEITPVTSINGLSVGDGCPGKITADLLVKYLDLVSNNEDQTLHDNWLSPISSY